MACRTEKPILLCAASIIHSPVRADSPGPAWAAASGEAGASWVTEERGEELRVNSFMGHLVTARVRNAASPVLEPTRDCGRHPTARSVIPRAKSGPWPRDRHRVFTCKR